MKNNTYSTLFYPLFFLSKDLILCSYIYYIYKHNKDKPYFWMNVFGNRENVDNVFLIEDLFVLYVQVILPE